jgi:iron complex outermembrane receptor protein
MHTQHTVNDRPAPPRLLLSAISLGILALANQVAAQEAPQAAPQEAPAAAMTRVEVTGSSIKRVASEASLPVSTIRAEELVKQGMTTLADVMMALPQSASLAPSAAGSGTNINLRGLGVTARWCCSMAAAWPTKRPPTAMPTSTSSR